MKKPKKQISLKLKQSTIKDILLLGEKKGHKCFSETLRYLIHTGFSNLGNWRKEEGKW